MRYLTLILTLVLVLAACGEDDDDKTSNNTNNVATDAGDEMGSTNNSSNGSTNGSSNASTNNSSVNLCEKPYRCNPDEKLIRGLERKYSLEECDPATGEWTEIHDCSDFDCSCKSTGDAPPGSNYAECSWDFDVCNGIRYEF